MKNNFPGLRMWFVVVAMFIGLDGCTGTSAQQSTGEYLDDSVITAKVKSAFVADQQVSALAIKVETFKGVVRLSGSARSQQEIDRAVEVTRNVKGVTSVENNIQIK